MRNLILALLICLTANAQQDTYTGVAKVVALGDVHGDYGQMAGTLRAAGVINAKDKWIGGKTHLVQIGDLPDRGPDTRRIVKFFMELEKQAKKAGGAVHCLIGNHEVLNMIGDFRYVTPEEYAAYRTGESESLRSQYYELYVKNLKRELPRKEFDEQFPPGWVEHMQAWSLDGEIGKWVMGHNAILKVNDTLFVHAGLSEKMLTLPLSDINKTVQKELKARQETPMDLAMGNDGPLWYRGLVNDPPETAGPLVDKLLDAFGVARIVIGHTVLARAIVPRFGGKLIDIDAGLSKVYGGPQTCLILEGQKLTVLYNGKMLELPPGNALPYLKAVQAIMSQPAQLQKFVDEAAR